MKSSADDKIEKLPPARNKLWRLISLAIIAVAAGLLIFSGLGLWQQYRATHTAQPLPDSLSVATSDAAPDETAISSTDSYSVPDNQPRSISLPSISAQGFIQKVGLDKNGSIAVPSNVYMAGWFTGSGTPGQKGLSIIDGHVQGKYAPGIFKNLSKLKTEDVFTVEFGNKTTQKFKVVSVKSYTVDTVNAHLFEKLDTIESQLNLITCGGKYDSASQQYLDRVLVVSKLVE